MDIIINVIVRGCMGMIFDGGEGGGHKVVFDRKTEKN
jgi:hypothetical protein